MSNYNMNKFSYISIQTYAIGIQKSPQIETVLQRTQNMLRLMDKKIFIFLLSSLFLMWIYVLVLKFLENLLYA